MELDQARGRRCLHGWTLLPVLLLIASCGGGDGGGGSGPPPPQNFAVTATASTGGSISPSSRTVTSGSTTTFTVTPDTGFTVDAVAGCGGSLSGDQYTTGSITSACSVTASFELQTHTVTAEAGENGSITPSDTEVDHGQTASFTVTPDAGYVVDQASGCGASLSGSTLTTGDIEASCSIQVSFRRPYVAGHLIIAEGSAVDGDVNDPRAPYVPNDTFQDAQSITNPVALGGYVNLPGEGATGPSLDPGDEFDVYRVAMLGGQLVILEIASPDVSDDLDLLLFDEDFDLVDASIHPTSRIEWVLVPPNANGVYYLAVSAFEGASNYTLTISHTPATMDGGWRLSDPFVAGEAVARLHPDFSLHAGPLAEKISGQTTTLGRGDEHVPRNTRIVLESALTPSLKSAVDRNAALPDGAQVTNQVVREKLDTLLAIKELVRDPAVEYAQPNFLHELQAPYVPSDPLFQYQWHYPQISLPEAWNLSTGAGVVVAVLDSGVLLDHPDLAPQVMAGYDFVRDVAGGTDPGESPPPIGGSGFHGTHVAGTIAAAGNNNIGTVGVAFDASLLPVRVCSSMCTSYAIEQGLRFAAGLPNDSGTVPASPADVINLSLGRGGSSSTTEQELYSLLHDLGISVVAAAGNLNTDAAFYPAAYDGVIAVGAVDMQRERAPYSNFGSWVDIVAPGGDLARDVNADGFQDGVLSTRADDRSGVLRHTFGFLQGTSMAAPHVAGVVALMRAVAPGLSPVDIENLIRSGAMTDDLGDPGHDDAFGYGQVNAYKSVTAALAAAGAPVPPIPQLIASPTALNFGAALTELTVTLSNAGGGSLQFGEPTESSGGWLFGSSEQIGDNEVWTITIDRSGLADGAYEADIFFPSDANSVLVRVYMQVADAQVAEAGLQYVLLVDPDSFETIGQAVGEPLADGRVRFRVDDVSPGAYYLVSGSDSDNDGFICGRGESCGFYRSFGDPVQVEVDGDDIDHVDFVVGYGIQPGTAATDGAGHGFRRLQGGVKRVSSGERPIDL